MRAWSAVLCSLPPCRRTGRRACDGPTSVRPAALADVAGARVRRREVPARPTLGRPVAAALPGARPPRRPAPVTVTTPGGPAASRSVRSCAAPVVVAASTVVRRNGTDHRRAVDRPRRPNAAAHPGRRPGRSGAQALGVAAVLPAGPAPAVVVAPTALVLDASALCLAAAAAYVARRLAHPPRGRRASRRRVPPVRERSRLPAPRSSRQPPPVPPGAAFAARGCRRHADGGDHPAGHRCGRRGADVVPPAAATAVVPTVAAAPAALRSSRQPLPSRRGRSSRQPPPLPPRSGRPESPRQPLPPRRHAEAAPRRADSRLPLSRTAAAGVVAAAAATATAVAVVATAAEPSRQPPPLRSSRRGPLSRAPAAAPIAARQPPPLRGWARCRAAATAVVPTRRALAPAAALAAGAVVPPAAAGAAVDRRRLGSHRRSRRAVVAPAAAFARSSPGRRADPPRSCRGHRGLRRCCRRRGRRHGPGIGRRGRVAIRHASRRCDRATTAAPNAHRPAHRVPRDQLPRFAVPRAPRYRGDPRRGCRRTAAGARSPPRRSPPWPARS